MDLFRFDVFLFGSPISEMELTYEEIEENSVLKSDFKFIAEDSDPEENDVFRPCLKKIKIYSEINSKTTTEDVVSSSSNVEDSKNTGKLGSVPKNDPLQNIPSMPKATKIPKIYFCTRTHKQLSQAINELRRTKYNDIKMCILSSRNHSCIHERGFIPDINKNDLCQELLDPKTGNSCEYYNSVKKYNHDLLLRSQHLPSVWDLEDLISFGKKKIVCPYYTARELMGTSDVIFCPYNYVINPLIRQSMNISLKGNILIFDEAHNIEDTCRESASFSIQQDNIVDAIKECEETLKYLYEDLCDKLVYVLSSLSNWIDKRKNEITNFSDYDEGKLIIFGAEAVESFKDYEFGPGETFEKFKQTFGAILAEKEANAEEDSENNTETIPGRTKSLIQGLILVLEFLYDPAYTCDYHVVVTKSMRNRAFEVPETDTDGWFSTKKKKQKNISEWRYALHFWCFNPATVFNEIKEKVRSVVLTSGTLSPMNSFQSELGVSFPIMLEANHVIDQSQIGIPFPSIKDSQVILKKKYNDQHQHSKGLLGGNDWYQIQAYRALNQALGRCIRHRNDWGAILLIDNRFANDYYYRSLSKWVRNKINHHKRYIEMLNHLSVFIENRLQIDKNSG
ncbi:hypothetical protein PGB90_004466 [Kerria lacca]